jgi:two-component system response regulator GlrR
MNAGVTDERELSDVYVLFVDDDADTLEIFTMYLTYHGAHVHPARCAEEALTLLDIVRPHIIVSDMWMPEMTGPEFIRRVRKLPGMAEDPIPAIAYTEFAHMRDEALAAGFHAYLMKSFAPRVLVSEIARLLER